MKAAYSTTGMQLGDQTRGSYLALSNSSTRHKSQLSTSAQPADTVEPWEHRSNTNPPRHLLHVINQCVRDLMQDPLRRDLMPQMIERMDAIFSLIHSPNRRKHGIQSLDTTTRQAMIKHPLATTKPH
jgi:hypothetical protein